MSLFNVIHLFVVLCLVEVFSDMEKPVVQTKLGKYMGRYIKTKGNRLVYSFNGIRYAKPPVNQLRFKDPERIEPHQDIYDATKDGDDCLQKSDNYTKYSLEEMSGNKYVGSEDCLFLNVYTPDINPKKKYPVMIHIHGGSFTSGTGSSNWHGPQLLLDKDVVLVTINYRLGVFGFLSLDDEILPGNLGLKDQSLAIHWVKENIEAFGGDAELITVMGHSAGGVCAQMQMLSPRNKGIIKRTIIQSGSMECPFGFMPKKQAKDFALELSTALNCPESPLAFLACLQEKTAEKILNALETLKKRREAFELLFLPVFESKSDGFITEQDYYKGSTTPIMTGITKDDAVILYRDLYRSGAGSLSHFNEHYKHYLPKLFLYAESSNSDLISELIKVEYFGDQEMTNNVDEFNDMVTDGFFLHGTLKTTRKHKGNSYLYLLTHQGEKSLTNDLPFSRVCHADDLFYLFPFSKSPSTLTFNEADSKVQKLIVDLWTNFATFGNPTPDKSDRQWPESEKGKFYVSITSEGLQQDKHLRSARMSFWENIFSEYVHNADLKDEL